MISKTVQKGTYIKSGTKFAYTRQQKTFQALKHVHNLLYKYVFVKGYMSTETLIQLSVQSMSHREKNK